MLEQETNMKRKRMHVVWAGLSLLAVLNSGCLAQRGRLEKNLVNEVIRKCPDIKMPCHIDLKFIDWVDWDTMTVFAVGTDDSEINRILGENSLVPSRSSLSLVIALRRNGKVVYIEDDPRKIEGYEEGDVEFEDVNPETRFVDYPRNAELAVQRISTEKNGTYYGLRVADPK